MTESILYQVSERVATLTLNRPQRKNALDQAALDALVERIGEARGDDGVWILVIRAAGGDFCVGQDIKELSDKGNQGDYFEPVFRALKRTYKPVLCAAQGLCLAGGAGILMGADIRILGSSARLGWPHAKIGLCSIGAPSTLARMVPLNLALELMFTGDYLDAQRAFALGLVNHVVAEADFDVEIARIVAKVSANAPLAQRAMKQATLTTLDLPYEQALAQAHAILDRTMLTRDAREGMRAFVEKRQPDWQAR
ncbi:MAG: enoyl-CoA hydratase/isomerase family protein [Burkholderiales bacterium]|nr:enoyl-CoA hydratase/isomerase family protein [Burkholderiales bacterium]